MLGYELPAGHRLRVGISPTYARQAWPSPQPVTLTVFTGERSRLVLPVRTPQPDDGRIDFPPPESAPPLAVTTLRESKNSQTLTRNQIEDRLILKIEQDEGRVRFPNEMEVDDWSLETHSLREGDPLSVEQRVQARLAYRRRDWVVRIETESRLTCDETHFFVENRMTGFEGDTEVFAKSWTAKIDRDHL